MVSRRRLLQTCGAALGVTAGCVGDSRPSSPAANDATDTPPAGSLPDDIEDGPTRTPEGPPDWTPDWTMGFDDRSVLGLDAGDSLVYATLSTENDSSAVAAVDPARQSVEWQTVSEGEAVGGSHAAYQDIARGQWGVTVTDESVYAVAGPAEERQWSAVHALDRATGERRWSLQRSRDLAVEGVTDGLVVVTGLEFFPPPGQTAVSHQTPESPLSTVVYGIDADTGTVRWDREFLAVEDAAVAASGVYVAAGDRLAGLTLDGSDRFEYGHGPATAVEAVGDRAYYLSGEREGAVLHGVAPDGTGDWRHAVPVEELLLDGDRLYAGGGAVLVVEPDGTVPWRDTDYGKWLLLDPSGDRLYTRSQVQADAATAYDTAGTERWTFDPPVNNAWPEAATDDALVVDTVSGPLYAVDADGRATGTLERETVFDALGLNGRIYLADGVSELVALTP